jgi:ATP-binding cassette subfamily B protein
MKLLYSYLRQYWKLVFLALFLAAVNQIFSLLDPYIFQHVIDNYALKFNQYSTAAFFKGIGLLLLAAVGVAFISRVAKNFQDYFVNVITQKLGAQIYTDGVKHSLELPYQLFEDQRSGQTLSVLQKVRLDVERLISAIVNVLFTTLVGVVFVTIVAINIYWLIAPIYFSSIPIIGFISSALAGTTTESLRNIELVKSLGLGNQEIKRLNSTTGRILILELKKVKYLRSLSFIQGTAVNFIRTTILFLMLYLIHERAITVGQFFQLFIYSFFIFGPLQSLGEIIGIYREAEVSLNNFQDILNLPVEVKPVNPILINNVETLEFDKVGFKHQSAASKALNEISFQTEVGETIAFVGPSGAGKTTLVKLLVGLYSPQEGNILYNGHPGGTIDFDRLRKKIGFVTQDTQLFSGTIKENLLYVNPAASDQDITDVLNQAACQTLLARADNGLDTMIGEGGVKVSGGEKQRLSIARALLRKPQILVFDEATSSLDSITEEEISETIRNISGNGNLIVILIAHRLSTILHADKIYVLERGQITESGKHNELLDIKGLYYAMWRQQIGERELQKSEVNNNLNYK